MRDFGQDQQPASEVNSTNKVKLILSVIVVLAIAIVVVFWLAAQQDDKQPTIQQPERAIEAQPVAQPELEVEDEELVPEVSETVELEPEPEPEPEPVQPLPTMAMSSAAVIDELQQHEQNTALLKGEQLIRDTVVFVDNIRQGLIIRDKSVVEGPKSAFRVLEQNGKLYIDPRSYDRYNIIVDWFVSLDTAVLVSLFNRYEPLSQEALAEIGYPDEAPQTVLVDAINVLLATPSVGTVIELNDDSVMYRYADPALEELPAAQKQMLRIGPDNIRRVKLKLEALKQALQQ